jgi:hypothetical protein
MDPHMKPAANGRPPRLLDQARDKLRTLHYSYRTEQQYLQWIRRFILFHGKQHPSAMGAPEVESFLTDLAVRRKVSASTQNQALAMTRGSGGVALPDAVERKYPRAPFE